MARRPTRSEPRKQHSLGPRFWAVINDRTDNPLVQNGKATALGVAHLERLKRKKEHKMTRSDFLELLRVQAWFESHPARRHYR